MKINLANGLTLFRIALLPVMVVVFYLPYHWTHLAAAAIFCLAGVTDWADGWIARRFKMTTAFGAFLDPVADKLAVMTALLLVVQSHPTVFLTLVSIVIIGREIAITALREWMATAGARASIKVAFIGKLKTTFQLVALLCLLYQEPIAGIPVFTVGEVLLAIAAILTLSSGAMYLVAAFRELSKLESE